MTKSEARRLLGDMQAAVRYANRISPDDPVQAMRHAWIRMVDGVDAVLGDDAVEVITVLMPSEAFAPKKSVAA